MHNGTMVKLISIGELLVNKRSAISLKTNFTFNEMIVSAAIHDSIFCHMGITKSPIFFLSLTKCINGITAKPSCKLKITWLRINNLPVAPSPKIKMVKKAE